jgi:hypothetical protein
VKKSKDWLAAILKRAEPKILETILSQWAKTDAERMR